MRAVMVIAQSNFRDEELLQPKKILEDVGIKVDVASLTMETATGKLGAEVTPDITLNQVNVHDYDALIFVGGGGARDYFENEQAHSLARNAKTEGKVVAAICIAPVILANAGLLSGKEATVFSTEVSAIEAKGAVYTGKEVENDDNIITASGPEDAREFGEKVSETIMRSTQ